MPNVDSKAILLYVEKLQLLRSIAAEKGQDSPEWDAMAEELDGIWYSMTPEEIEQIPDIVKERIGI